MPGDSSEGVRPFPVEQATPDFFRFAVAGAMDAIVVTSAGLEPPDPKILYVNAAFERMSGYAAEEVVGKSPRMLRGPHTDRALLERLRLELEAGREFHGQTVNYRKDGSEYHVEWRVTAVRDGGQITSWVAIQRDVTREVLHERVVEEELRAANEELAANNRDMATFTDTVSHDLRQPARAIVANARWLEEDFGDLLPPEAQDLLKRQSSAAIRMGSLIDDLLKMTRLGRTAVVRERLDVGRLIASVWNEQGAEHEGASLQIQPGMEADASPSLLGVVYQNLLGNALKFRRPETPLVVEAGRLDDGTFFVRDNGSGFDSRYAHKIFEPFERLHRADVEGTGFGLHNAQRIAEQHGGRMWAEGTEGQGATFLVTLGEGAE